MFDAIDQHIAAGDTIIFDITNGFRSLPVLAFLAASFVRVVRGVSVAKMVYGAFDATVDGKTPVFDLTPFITLLDWTTATDAFLKFGRADDLARLVRSASAAGAAIGSPEALGPIADTVGTLTSALQTSRPVEVMRVTAGLEAQIKSARQASAATARPFGLLLDRSGAEYSGFGLADPMSPAMPRTTGGDKRSSWLTFHRRLFLVRWLIRGPADAATLIADACAFFGADAEIYPPDARAALRHDIAALREEFDCVIRLDAKHRYALEESGRLALLDLPDADMEALAFLLANFADAPLPNAPQVDILLDRIVALLPPNRRAQLQQPVRDIRFELPQPAGAASDHTLRKIKRALRRQQISFSYGSSYAQGDALIAHRVGPYDLLFRDGHVYLDAFCYDCGMPEFSQRYRLYRLDRIAAESLQFLPDQLPPFPPPRAVYRLCYTLSPAIARQRDIALWFPQSEVVFLPDGAARITARTTDLWQARQILLRYREHCQVLEPPELVEMIQESAARILELYNKPNNGAPAEEETR